MNFDTIQPYFHPDAFDRLGVAIQVFDLVKVVEIPDWYLNDIDGVEENNSYDKFKNCYGLVKYNHWNGPDGKKRWFGENNLFMVDVIHCDGNCISFFELCLGSDYVEKIPYNIILMNLFVNYDWPMLRIPDKVLERNEFELGVNFELDWPVMVGTPHYDIVKGILEAPYGDIVKAHDAVVNIIPSINITYR